MPPRSPLSRSLLLICAFVTCFSTALIVVPESAKAQAVTASPGAGGSATSAATASPSAALESTAVAIPDDGTFTYRATVTLTQPTPYLQVRLRIHRPSGRLLFQKTHVRTDLAPGSYAFDFAREISDFDLKPGTYPVELSVVSEGDPPNDWTIAGSLRVFDPDTQPLRIVPVIRVTSAPSVDPQGRFVVDPRIETRARDEVIALAEAILGEPKLRASIAIAPELLEEWKTIAQGFSFAGPAGVEEVAASSSAARAYAQALQRVKDAVATRRLDLLSVPYADPDVAGLASIGREKDLGDQLTLGAEACADSLDLTATACLFPARSCLTDSAARQVAASGIRHAIVAPRFLRDGESTASAGVYVSSKAPLTLLAADAGLGRLLGGADATATTESVFRRALEQSDDQARTLPVVIEVGPGRAATVTGFIERVRPLLGQAWIGLVTARTAAATAERKDSYSFVKRVSVVRGTPSGWWSSIAAARRYAEALQAVLLEGEQAGVDAITHSLIAEAATWAGPDGKWALADRGRSFASAAVRSSLDVLDTVTVTGNDLTLSSARGDVPFSIMNTSGRNLNVVLRFTPQDVAIRGRSLRSATLLPAENYVTVPVDLQASAGGRLRLQVVAGTLVIASTTVEVRASYLDRLAVVGAIVVLLGAMLFFIRRRVRTAEVATSADAGTTDDTASAK